MKHDEWLDKQLKKPSNPKGGNKRATANATNKKDEVKK